MIGLIFSALPTIIGIAATIIVFILIYRLVCGETRFISKDEMRENLLRKMKHSHKLKKQNRLDFEI